MYHDQMPNDQILKTIFDQSWESSKFLKAEAEAKYHHYNFMLSKI